MMKNVHGESDLDLFEAAGVDRNGRGSMRAKRPPPLRSLRVPLFKQKAFDAADVRRVFDPSAEQTESAARYARKAQSPRFARLKESVVREQFVDLVLQRVLGYRPADPENDYTIEANKSIRAGFADWAVGRFSADGSVDEIHAPIELKGPAQIDLDAVPPGQRRSPVQQGWDYAVDAPGVRWVIVSNCIELRLYRVGCGRDAYEVFDLRRLDEADEHRRLWHLLAADHLLGGFTQELLDESDAAFKSITDDLYVDYKNVRDRLFAYLTDAAGGPRLPAGVAIEQTQKLLDRMLFVAFAERNGLLPDRIVARAEESAKAAFVPQAVWANFRALFRFVDEGNSRLYVPAYNGGLFAHDPIADTVDLPDDLASALAGLAKWDYRDDVPVTMLGHLFEQSITDIEKQRAMLRGEEVGEDFDRKRSRKKRHGIVYTPDDVTRFVVDRTLGLTLRERGEALAAKHDQRFERGYWSDHCAMLRDLTVVDPACGSGHFLVAAFDVLAAEYRRVAEKLADLDAPIDFDPFDEIVTRNLYGVDINTESVEITRLALWLKTARYNRKLPNLDHTIRVGDSLVADAAYTDRPFDWAAAFPEIRSRGGFDVVIGNPPYVRMERIRPFKPYLAEHYRVADDRTDLYAYFFEKGLDLLRPDGRLGYISSSTFFRTGSGEKLRMLLSERTAIETVVDFGDRQLFEGVTTYPAVLTLRRAEPAAEQAIDVLDAREETGERLGPRFSAAARSMAQARLGAGSWQFEDDALAALRTKITAGRRTLGEVYGAPLRGIVTGLNEAFVVDRETRDRLAQDGRSAALLVPFLRGEDIKRWCVEPEDLYLLNIPKGTIDIDDHPAIRTHLAPFRKQLEARATKQAWFELQQAQLAYQPAFASPKIMFAHFAARRGFAWDAKGFFGNDKSYAISTKDIALLALLNSSVAWFVLCGLAPAVRGGFRELRVQYVEKLPIPNWKTEERAYLERLADVCTSNATRRHEIELAVARRIIEITPVGRPPTLSAKLRRWWELSFPEFLAEVEKTLKTDIPLKKRAEWERYLDENRREVLRSESEVEAAEREIDEIVYRVFGLSPDEIGRLEAAVAERY
jgi:hypothetical protein